MGAELWLLKNCKPLLVPRATLKLTQRYVVYLHMYLMFTLYGHASECYRR